MDEELNLLDCIAHNTTTEEYLKSFSGNATKAAHHLRKFYIDNGGEITDKDTLDSAEEEARQYFDSL